MEEVPVTQARAELSDLVNRVVYAGERIVLTRHGRAVAAIVSAADLERLTQAPEPDGSVPHLTVLDSGVASRDVSPPQAPAAGPSRGANPYDAR
jgi:prevent-host-death family protein